MRLKMYCPRRHLDTIVIPDVEVSHPVRGQLLTIQERLEAEEGLEGEGLKR